MYDFSHYELIIDARSPAEYLDDHLPNAVNLPVVNNEEYAEVGTLHRTDKMEAYRIGGRYALLNIARYLDEILPLYSKQGRILVYCFRGGKRSKIWVDVLQSIGYPVDRMQGGWKAYRRWVNEQLTNVPSQFHYHVLCGPTGCGKTRLLAALRDSQAQVLDLESIASHRGSVLGALPGIAQPTQKYFDTLLLDQLLKFDRTRPVWIEAESKKIGNVQLPTSLLNAMRAGRRFHIETSMAERVTLIGDDYRHFESDPTAMLAQLKHLRPLVGGAEFSIWEELAKQGTMHELFERLMRNHYDPAYHRSLKRNYPHVESSSSLTLTDLSMDALRSIAQSLES